MNIEVLEKEYFSPKEICYKFGIGKDKLYQLLNSGELEARKIGKYTRITSASVRTYFESCPTWKEAMGKTIN